MLLWGKSGGGKTTLASTAPLDLLWINFDPDGTKVLSGIDGIKLIDLSFENSAIVERICNSDNPLELDNFLSSNPNFRTVVVDSVTSFGDKGIEEAVKHGKGSTIFKPSLESYGRRNVYTLAMIKSFLRITAKHNANIIFICHQGSPNKNELTGEILVSLLMGGQLPEMVPLHLSEVWRLDDDGKKRTIHIRSSSMYKPMKTRMFVTSKAPSFLWTYNAEADAPKEQKIQAWYDAWAANGFKKIPLPK